jgi:hypothetical protein
MLQKQNTQEKRPLKSGPKFREETPKKGSDRATPIAISHCKNSLCLNIGQAQKGGAAALFYGCCYAVSA